MSIPRRWWKFLAILWTILILVGTLMPQGDWVQGVERGGRWIQIPYFDKVVHFTLFAGFVVLWWLASDSPRARLVAILAAGLALAALTELGQAIPFLKRDAGLDDLAADLAGCVLAAAGVLWLARRRVPASA
jgi:hypothetical protein